MPKLKASQENVFKACEKLSKKGKRISINNVREAIGGGSQSTISELINEWKSNSVKQNKINAHNDYRDGYNDALYKIINACRSLLK